MHGLESHDHRLPPPLKYWRKWPEIKQRALTNVLARQASVAGHVDKEDVFASILLEGDVLLPIEGEGSILEDGAAHTSLAVLLEQRPAPGSS